MSDYKEFEDKMKKTCDALTTQFATIRAGRANAAVLDQITVDYYGSPTPINQVASIGSPDPRSLLIQPWDGSILKGIEKAILSSDLGIHPQNDGRMIRQEVRRGGQGRHPQHPPRRDREVQEAAEGLRHHRGRLQDRREGYPEADRRLHQGDRQDHRAQGQGTERDLMGEKNISTGGAEKPAPPRHIAIILDGNGRWAKRRGLPRTAGHAVGSENFRKIATYCRNIGVEYLTVYAFSTENWKRPEDEVKTIMRLLGKYLHEAIDTMERDHIKMKVLGNVAGLPEELRELVAKTDEISSRYEGFQANICLNYGGRDEIVRAAMRYAADLRDGKAPEEIGEAEFGNYLYSAGIPDPELLIRPGGEERISNFLLWQCAYSEFYFTDVLWPDFTTEELDKAIAEYHRRDRRFGAVK